MKRRIRVSAAMLEQRRNVWLGKLAQIGPVMRGSLVTAQRGNHVAHQLTVSINGKTHTVYVPLAMVKEVKQWTSNYRRMQRIVREVSKLNMALIHRHVPESRAGGKSLDQRCRSR